MSSIDDQIEQAIREGKFDNLSGAGKPFEWDENPHEDPEWALAHHILKNGGFTLSWLETFREIKSDHDDARQVLTQAWQYRKAASKQNEHREATWQQALQAFRDKLTALNKRILAYNLEVPLERFEYLLCKPDQEIQEIISLGVNDE